MAELDLVDLLQDVMDKGCCKRCALRYINSPPGSFEDPESSLIAIGVMPPISELLQGPPVKRKKLMNACIVCLGLLEDTLLEAITNHQGIRSVNQFNSKDYTLNVTFVPSILLRERSMIIYLKEKFGNDFNPSHVVSFHKAWRYSVEKKITQLVGKSFCHDSRVRLHIITHYDLDVDESFVIRRINKKLKRKLNFGKRSFVSSLEACGDDHFKKFVRVPPRVSMESIYLKEVTCFGQDFIVVGKYCKFSRDLNQLPLKDDDKTVILTYSVSSIITDAFKQILGDQSAYEFQASSFEEAHDRVLNKGRSFFIAITKARFGTVTDEQIYEIQSIINQSNVIIVQNLEVSNRKSLHMTLEVEKLLPKRYRVLCTIEGPKPIDDYVKEINSFSSLKVLQKTPVRILGHRDYNLVREKEIYNIHASVEQGKRALKNLIVVDLVAQNGLYIPEFIHSDFGRTKPSLGTLCRAKADILALDILDLSVNLIPLESAST